VGTQKIHFGYEDQLTAQPGPLFPKESGSVVYGSNSFLREISCYGVLGESPKFLCRKKRPETESLAVRVREVSRSVGLRYVDPA
jgi:hypothetical protein